MKKPRFYEGMPVEFIPHTFFDASYYISLGLKQGDTGEVVLISGAHGQGIWADPNRLLVAVRWKTGKGTKIIGTDWKSVRPARGTMVKRESDLGDASDPREGLPSHEMPEGMPGNLFTSHAIRWGTNEPHWIGEPFGRTRGYAEIPFVAVPALVKKPNADALIPIARQKALAFADVMGWTLAFRPVMYFAGKRKFTDQFGKNRFGEKTEIWFEIIKGLSFSEKSKLPPFGKWGN